MVQPRVKRVRPIAKRQRPVRCSPPTPERRAWVIAEIRRRLGVTDPEIHPAPQPPSEPPPEPADLD